MKKSKAGLSTQGVLIAMLIIVMLFAAMSYLVLQAYFSSPRSSGSGIGIDVTPVTVPIKIEWAPQVSGQDRFFPDTIVVDQGDTIDLTFISNDSDAHTFTIAAPYNFQMNISAAGMINYLTNANFTGPSTGNSAGVTVSGTIGNMTATGSFVAKYAGTYEYFCVYHVQLGMFGYITVLPNSGYTNSSSS
jgi:plastocyanin